MAAALLSTAEAVPEANGASWTPLHLGSFLGREDVVRALLREGADPSGKDSEGKVALALVPIESPLHMVYANELLQQIGVRNYERVEALLQGGLNVNMNDGVSGNTPAHWAVRWGGAEVASIGRKLALTHSSCPPPLFFSRILPLAPLTNLLL